MQPLPIGKHLYQATTFAKYQILSSQITVVQTSGKRPDYFQCWRFVFFYCFKVPPHPCFEVTRDTNRKMNYSTSPIKQKFCLLHQNFNMKQYFVVIGALYIEII